MNKYTAIAKKVTAAYMATGYYKNISGQGNWVQHGAREVDRMISSLLRELSSPLEAEKVGSVLTQVRSVRATLNSLSDAVAQLQITTGDLEDELHDRVMGKNAALPAIVPAVEQEHGISQYKELNDAYYVTGDNGYLRGSTQIWYMNPSFFRDGIMGYDWLLSHDKLPDWRKLRDTHILLGAIRETNPGRIFYIMQGDDWSPKGEGNTLVHRLGLRHTSMSVGDIIVQGNSILLVDNVGFKQLR